MRWPIALCYRCEDKDADDLYSRLIPGGLLCLHGVLRKSGFHSRLFNFSGVPWPEINQKLASFHPRLIGVSHFTHNHRSSMRLYESARKVSPEAVILGGGAQATFLDDVILERSGSLDGVIRGEGETAILELAERLASGESWQDTPGLTVRSNNGPVRQPEAAKPAALDTCYPLERFEETDGVLPEEQFPFVVTSRGCPGRCTFCDSPEFWGRRVRFRTTAGIINEIRYLMRDYGFMYFGFRDDTFTANKPRLRELCLALQNETPGILWNCQSRVDLVDEERLLWMKQAGCEQIQFGIESMAPEVTDLLGKRVDPLKVHSALKLCRQFGIRSCAYFITGVPGQTGDSLKSDFRLFSEHGLQEGIVSPLCYYPGTALFRSMNKSGAVDTGIFLSGRTDRLIVRQDSESKMLHDSLCDFIASHGPRNAFRENEIKAYLNRTGRCFSALLDWGRYCMGSNRTDDARAAFQEIRERWPDNPWGCQAQADLAESYGQREAARRHRAAADRAARMRNAE